MSETTDASIGIHPQRHIATGPADVKVAHEAYSFACMKCGYGWEQAYAIEHHSDLQGRAFVVYRADGVRVPSPLTSPTCPNCNGHVVRILRSGRVSSVRQGMAQARRGAGEQARTGHGKVESGHGDGTAPGLEPASDHAHHWSLKDLLHLFQRTRG
jgi:hypothetical protein